MAVHQAPPTQAPAGYDGYVADDESLSIFTLDILVVYGLIACGKRISSAD